MWVGTGEVGGLSMEKSTHHSTVVGWVNGRRRSRDKPKGPFAHGLGFCVGSGGGWGR